MIELIELTKYFKSIRAVDGINLSVGKGVLYGFLGPNGAGKTTTLKMMAGVLKPTKGRILLGGRDLSREPTAVKKNMAFIPDHPFLYEKLTAVEFLRFVSDLYALDKTPVLEKEILRLLELFGLEDRRDELVEGYSHGMKQRLVMCAALLHRPQVLIVDEPMVGLDPSGARLVKDIFRREARAGTTIFMSTHSLEVAEELCDEIAIIQAGKIIAQGPPEVLKSKAGGNGNLESLFLSLTKGNSKSHDAAHVSET
ncbi:MAG: ABC transporter ATP-binding protein [Desulfatiglandaceae bacterium]|jgi:ABC-2 type transport system ATP-binding protein